MPQVQSLQPSYLRSPEPAQQEAKISEETKAKREICGKNNNHFD